MAHFFTGLYYFTWFQILIIIVTGGVVGQSLVSIYDLIQAIRRDRPIKPKIYMLLPWLIVSVILLLSPVYSSNLGSAWMLIFAVIEILSAVLTRKIFDHRQQDQVDNGEQLNTEPIPSDNDFTNDSDHYEYNPGVSQDTVSEEPQHSQAPVFSQPAESQASVVSNQPAEPQSSAVQAPSSVSSQPASVVSQAQPAVSRVVSAASQSVSQAAESEEDEMDKLFDYNENTDAELAEEARERQEKAQSDQAKIAKRLSEMEADYDKAN